MPQWNPRGHGRMEGRKADSLDGGRRTARVQADLARDLGVPVDRVRVMVPDMGGGFGGKHTGEAALEAARLAGAAGPVAVHWTRAEEFTWAYFRPAAVIECRAGMDQAGLVNRLGLHQHQCRRLGHRSAL